MLICLTNKVAIQVKLIIFHAVNSCFGAIRQAERYLSLTKWRNQVIIINSWWNVSETLKWEYLILREINNDQAFPFPYQSYIKFPIGIQFFLWFPW